MLQPKVFSSKVDTALREENALNQKPKAFWRFNEMSKCFKALPRKVDIAFRRQACLKSKNEILSHVIQQGKDLIIKKIPHPPL